MQSLSIERRNGRGVSFSFDADLELHDRLCCWGADLEDLEDDAPFEDDDIAAELPA